MTSEQEARLTWSIEDIEVEDSVLNKRANYSPDQPRDERGRFGEGGGGGSKNLKQGTSNAMINVDYENIGASSDEILAISEYAGPGGDSPTNALNLNESLRMNSLSEDQQQASDKLDSVINKGILNEPIQVYRGMSLSESEISSITVGVEIQDKGFMSTTVSKKYASTWVSNEDTRIGILMHIVAPSGSRAIYLGAHETQGEKEMLFPRNTKLLVSKVVKVGAHYTIDAEVINEK